MKNLTYLIPFLFYFLNINYLYSQCDTLITASYFKNPDFELYSSCPDGPQELDRLDDWDQVTLGSSDFFHTCGFVNWNGLNTEPFSPYPVGSSANGTGAIGFLVTPGNSYAEYVGQCLKQPLLPNENYTLKFQATCVGGTDMAFSYVGDLILLGIKDCLANPLEIVGNLEGNNGFELIAEKRVDMSAADKWQEITIPLIPKNQYSYVALGLRISSLEVIGNAYTLIDGLILTKTCEEEECVAEITSVDKVFCATSSKIMLDATPSAGVWSGNGVSENGEFDPSKAEIGQNQIIYTLNSECADTITIEVIEGEEITIEPVDSICILDLTPILLNAKPPGGIWSGNGVVDSVFDVATAGVGTHTVVYSINGTCTNESSIDILITDTLPSYIEPIGPQCIKGDRIQLYASYNGGIWSGNGISITGLFDPAVAGVGLHTISYDSDGICANMANITIEVVDSLAPVITPVGALCLNDTLVFMTASISGGVWSGNGISSFGIFNASSAGVGTHKIEYVISQGACEGYASIDILVKDSPQVEITAIQEGCFPVNTIISYVTSDSVINCSWDLGDGNVIKECNAINHSYNESGCFDVTFKAESASGGCFVEKNEIALVCVDSFPIANFFSTPNSIKISNPLVNFTNLSKNASSYFWNFGGIGSSSVKDPTFIFPKVSATYKVCLTAQNLVNCKDSICHEVIVEGEVIIYVPNTFTPNGDGTNDTFFPIISGIQNITKYEFQVFNRWGEQVFKTFDLKQGWLPKKVSDAIFVWHLNISDNKGNNYQKNGHVTLLK